MTLSAYDRFAYLHLEDVAKKLLARDPERSLVIQRAHIPMRAEAYIATTILNSALAFVFALVLWIALVVVRVSGAAPVPTVLLALGLLLVVLVPAGVYTLAMVIPDATAYQRSRKIEAQLPFGAIYIATMANAGQSPAKIFADLGTQPIYGELAKEAALIARDLNLLGKDLPSTLTEASERTPSIKFRNFLQGAVTALNSGIDIKQYFLNKAEQFFYENKQTQRAFLDSLGIVAESFVTVVVAGTTFFIVLLSVMGGIGSGATGSLRNGYFLVLIALPLIQLAFVMTIHSITPES